jgi:uncharacterized RmlC-like cupin family protein
MRSSRCSLHAQQRKRTMRKSIGRWRTNDVGVLRAGELDANAAQTLAMHRRSAITTQRTGAAKLWTGRPTNGVKATADAYHHRDLASCLMRTTMQLKSIAAVHLIARIWREISYGSKQRR